MSYTARCDQCGDFVDARLRGNLNPLEEAVGRHAVANPGHKVWLESDNAKGEL